MAPNLNPADVTKYAHGPFTLPVPGKDVPQGLPILEPLRKAYDNGELLERPTPPSPPSVA